MWQPVVLKLLRRREMVWLLGAGIVARVLVFFVFDPVIRGDSDTYLAMARFIQGWNLSHDQGIRTPPYPVLVALLQAVPSSVFYAQAVLGLVVSVVIYLYFGLLGLRPWQAAMCGLIYSLNISSLVFEHVVMTETLVTLLVVGTLLTTAITLRSQTPRARYCLVFGTLGALAALTRPNLTAFALVLVLTTIYILWHRKVLCGRRLLIALSAGILPTVLMIGAWSTVNYYRFNWFTPSTITGLSLMDETQYLLLPSSPVPGRYRALAAVYREARLHPGESVTWVALPAAEKKTGRSLPQVSREMVGLSIWVYVHRPFRYMEDVLKAGARFFGPTLLSHRTWHVNRAERVLIDVYFGVYVLALGFSLFLLAAIAVRRSFWTNEWFADFMVMCMSVVAVALFTVPVDVSGTSRYRIPFEAVMFGWAILAGTELLRNHKERGLACRAAPNFDVV